MKTLGVFVLILCAVCASAQIVNSTMTVKDTVGSTAADSIPVPYAGESFPSKFYISNDDTLALLYVFFARPDTAIAQSAAGKDSTMRTTITGLIVKPGTQEVTDYMIGVPVIYVKGSAAGVPYRVRAVRIRLR